MSQLEYIPTVEERIRVIRDSNTFAFYSNDQERLAAFGIGEKQFNQLSEEWWARKRSRESGDKNNSAAAAASVTVTTSSGDGR